MCCHKNVPKPGTRGRVSLDHGLATTNHRRHHRHGKKPVRSTNRFFRARARRCHHCGDFMIRCWVLINTHTHTPAHIYMYLYTYIYVAAVAKLAIDHDRERIVGRTPSARGEVKRGDPAHKLLRCSAASSIWYLDFPSHTHTYSKRDSLHTANFVLTPPMYRMTWWKIDEGTMTTTTLLTTKQEQSKVRLFVCYYKIPAR